MFATISFKRVSTLYYIAAAACFVCLLVLCLMPLLNKPAPAPSLEPYPAVPPSIRPTTVEARLVYDTPNARVAFPMVFGLGSDEIADMVNRRLQLDFALNDMTRFVEQRQGSQTPWELDFGFEAELIGRVMHLRALRYTFAGGAHGSTEKMDAYIDTRTGAFYQLDDLFKNPAESRAQLASLIDQQIATHPEDFFPNAKAAPLPSLFSFTPNGLVIEYPPYTIGPYASGFLQFTIPADEALTHIDIGGNFFSALKDE